MAKQQLKSAALVASGTVLLDYIGHTFFTTPMELPQYFVAKWVGAFVATMIVLNYDISREWFHKAWGTAVNGGILFSVYAGLYYGIIAPLFKIPTLLPPYQIAIFGVTGPQNTIIWAVFHFAAYYFAYKILQTVLRQVISYG